MAKHLFLYLLCALLSFSAQAKELSTHKDMLPPPVFHFPLDCTLDQDCWLMNTPDTDKTDGIAQDSFCQNRTYDNHKGVDFAIRDKAAMDAGVNVLAASDGIVVGLRNGEADFFSKKDDWEAMQKAQKECGNGVLIRHNDGWFTQYCHLKNSSIPVKKGEPVRAGRKIGQIGMSGMTQHPHLHITFIHKDDRFDPFTGKKIGTGCKQSTDKPLWSVKPTPFAVYDAGFNGELPNFDDIPKGNRGKEANDDSAQFLFWGAFLGVETGDVIFMEIRDPTGRVFVNQTTTIENPKARLYHYTGRRVCQGFAEKGIYTGTAKLSRVLPNGETITRSIERTYNVP